MYNTWDVDLKDSVKALESIKDTYLPKVISGRIYTIESDSNQVLMKLDNLCGIDYIRENKHGMQGIAARVQWGNAWNTFTIREKRHTGTKTEYEKRLYQINNGFFYPYFTLQAYFDNRKDNNLLSIGVIKTLDLYEFIEYNPEKIFRRRSDNEFIYVKWEDIVKQNSKIMKKITNIPKEVNI
jgi:hypothetical protein